MAQVPVWIDGKLTRLKYEQERPGGRNTQTQVILKWWLRVVVWHTWGSGFYNGLRSLLPDPSPSLSTSRFLSYLYCPVLLKAIKVQKIHKNIVHCRSVLCWVATVCKHFVVWRPWLCLTLVFYRHNHNLKISKMDGCSVSWLVNSVVG